MTTLKEMREAKGLRLEDVAVATGYTYTHCVKLERNGAANPSHCMVARLAELYGVTEKDVANALHRAADPKDAAKTQLRQLRARRSGVQLPGVEPMPAFMAAGR